MPSGVHLFGGFVGTENSLFERSSDVKTTLSGNIGDPLLVTDNTNNILHWNSLLTLVTIDGFIIQEGYSFGTNADPRLGRLGNGAGIYVNARTGKGCLHINNCDFLNNQASLKGGAIFMMNLGCEGAAIRINNTSFIANEGFLGGGAIALQDRGNEFYSSFIENCLFTNNTGRIGGALSIFDNTNCGILRIENCEFTENEGALGGAIEHTDEHATGGTHINQCIFKRNKAIGSGGAICHTDRDTIQTTFINNCDFIENSCGIPSGEGGGGALNFTNINNHTTMVIPYIFYNNRFIGNLAKSGGAMNMNRVTGLDCPKRQFVP